MRHFSEKVATTNDPDSLRGLLSLLEEIAVLPGTADGYRAEVRRFVAWADQLALRLQQDDEIDRALSSYMTTCVLEGEHSWHGERLLAGLMFLDPSFSRLGGRKIARAWRSLKDHRRREHVCEPLEP